MIDSIFKRVIAYLIDMMLISIVVNSIISSKVVNFQLEEYQSLYNDYYEMYSLYLEQSNNNIKTCEDLEKAIEDKNLTEEKYISDLEELKDSYSKQEILEEDYNNKCLVIVEDYNSNKITEEHYKEQVDYYYYHLEKNSIVGYVVSIIVYLLYFVFFQGFTSGQTLGKKITRLKVVSIKEGERVSYKQLFVRTLFLPVNTLLQSLIYSVLMLVAILFIPKNMFMQVTDIFYFMNYILSLVLIFTISFYKGKVGVHDMIAHTKIIQIDFKGNEIKSKDEKVIEVKIAETSKKDEIKDKTKTKIKKNKKD